jgi:hypothetical protein
MCLLERRFSQWGNGTEDRKGTLWKERFRSVLLEAASLFAQWDCGWI